MDMTEPHSKVFVYLVLKGGNNVIHSLLPANRFVLTSGYCHSAAEK
jgi:hypothetical protein